MDIEHLLLCKVIHEADLTPTLEARVNADWFQDDEHRKVFVWMLDHWTAYGEVPSPDVLKLDYPSYRLKEAPEAYSFYIDRMRTARENELLMRALMDATGAIEDDEVTPDSRAIAAKLMSTLVQLDNETTRALDEDVIETYLERITAYREQEDSLGLLRGIRLGIPTLDLAMSGMKKGQLITLTGLPKSTKSFVLLNGAIEAHKFGKRVLFISFEMSNEEQSTRHDAMRGRVDYGKLQRGRLTLAEMARVERSISLMKNMQEFILSADIDHGTTVPGIAAKIDKYRPDIVFVDGIYMMDDVNGEPPGSPQALTNISRSLKRLAMRSNIPVVCTTQSLNQKVSKRTGIGRGSVGYSSAPEQDSDTLIAIDNLEDDDSLKRAKIVLSRTSANGVSCLVKWDWSTTTFEEHTDDEDTSEFDGGAV